ncbi:MAG: PEP-CTERM sorting domain-containing protein [Candidatus Acidiferrales bacterium]
MRRRRHLVPVFFTALASFCLFVWARPAAARPAYIVTLSFAGNAVCEVAYNPCPSDFGPVTGTFSVDSGSDTIVGAWSFSTPFGTISSSQPVEGANMFVAAGLDILDFASISNNVLTFMELDFAQTAIPGEGSFVSSSTTTFYFSSLVQAPPTLSTLFDFYDVTSGADSVVSVVTTPEPSTLLLLGTGLLGLFPVIRSRFARP